ncbi:glyoxalase-like domain-containing protein [Hyaloraphidium curvatum]|nr:glyoxalase-like domain-containing protein [Hyaloraphidium curvatum]
MADPLKHIAGVDHVVVAVRALDAAAAAWRALGFTLSPRGEHPPQLGTANHTLMLSDGDYIELLAPVIDTDFNAAMRAFLARGEGIDRVAFKTDDAAAGVAELKARGIDAAGPINFARPVDLPEADGGGSAEAAFNVLLYPPSARPAGLGLFACQQLTPDTVWIKSLCRHANGARGLVRVEILAGDPRAAAAEASRLLGRPVKEEADGAFEIATAPGLASLVFLSLSAFKARHKGLVSDADAEKLPNEGAAGLVVRTEDLGAARKCLGVSDGANEVGKWATGLLVVFVTA